jgi:carbon-monoxide dehydrogenase large subunit
LVATDYEILPVATSTRDALAQDAPRVWEACGSNVCVDAEVGDRPATDAAFARAAHVVALETWIARMTGVPLDLRAAVGEFDPATERYTLHAGSGGVVRQKRELAAILGVPEDRVRVVSGDVGGNYGTRNAFYPEFALVVWAARRVGRPVKWTCERAEAFLSDYQARDLTVRAELALDGDGRFLAFRSDNVGNIGAHAVSMVPLAKGVEIATGAYAIPAAHVRARAVLSNTPPTNPYRSAGRSEVIFVLERLVDLAARKTGIDPVALRRRNLVPSARLPYANGLGMSYDSGEFARGLDMAVALAEWSDFEARKRASSARGRLRGRAVAAYIDCSTGAPRERAEIDVRPEGTVAVMVGTLSSGQGHCTSFAQVACELLGVPFATVDVVYGDTDVTPVGGGSHSGRSMRMAGIVIHKASGDIIAKGRRVAAHVLEAAESDIAFSAGRYTVAGTDRSVGIFEVARAARDRRDLPDELRGPLAAVADETVPVPAYSNGCHVCEVEVDPETGAFSIARYAAVDDVGRVVNPMIVEGQTHGGVVQGLSQAMGEICAYDTGTGQLVSGSFMDYRLARADDVPYIATGINEVPTMTNALGVKTAGESGTTPSPAALIGAIVDALKDHGVAHIEMPATPERVWRAMRNGSTRPT